MSHESSPRFGATPPKKVLVVDDNTDVAESLREILESAGHTVTVATDAVTALQVAPAFAPEAAILDIELPVMNGYELAHHLRGLPHLAGCVLIAVTGYGQAHHLRHSHEAGFQHHLVKPIDGDRLLAILGALGAPPDEPAARA
ncbi:MAG: response regulator [Pseudomonadota bacterium]